MVRRSGILFLCLLLAGCATHPLRITAASLDYKTSVHKELRSLPPPEGKIVVAVYKFRDQTGQYKYHPTATTFSTAVTQGATSMLIKALEESGWFIPVEREGLPNLLTERRIYREGQKNAELPPLLFAPLLLDGGIIAYETNLLTGGLGARYFGAGGSAEFRSDSVTIFLRLTAVKEGRVLKSIMTQKTILSSEVEVGVFRFVRLKRLLEAEVGLSANEPPQMCVLEAIEKAVHSLILEGVLCKFWVPKEPEQMKPILQQYLEEKGEEKEVTFDEQGNLVLKEKP